MKKVLLKTVVVLLIFLPYIKGNYILADDSSVIQVYEEMGNKSILKKNLKVGMDNFQNKVIFFIGKAEAYKLINSKFKAKLNGLANIAMALKGVFEKQIKIVKRKNNITGLKNKVKVMVERFYAKNVNVSGAMVVSSYYRFIKSREYSKPIYQFYSLLSFPYSKYLKRRMKFLKNYFLKIRSWKNIRLYNSVKTALLKLDRQPNAGIN